MNYKTYKQKLATEEELKASISALTDDAEAADRLFNLIVEFVDDRISDVVDRLTECGPYAD